MLIKSNKNIDLMNLAFYIENSPDCCFVCRADNTMVWHFIMMRLGDMILILYTCQRHGYLELSTCYVQMLTNAALVQGTGPWFNIKMSPYRYRKSHCGDKTVIRSSYLHNGISYTGKMSSLYWIGAQLSSQGVMLSLWLLDKYLHPAINIEP